MTTPGAETELEDLGPREDLLETRGPLVGNSLITEISRVVYVPAGAYSQLPDKDRYALAGIVGRVDHAERPEGRILLIGPGRWGTTTPSLGVPVTFSDINSVAILCELAIMHEGLIPEVSMGTRFFNDLIENDMLYVAVYPGQKGYCFNEAMLLSRPNLLAGLLPDAKRWARMVHVVDFPAEPDGPRLFAEMDTLGQSGRVFLAGPK